MTAREFYEWAASCARELALLEGRMDALRLPRSTGPRVASIGGRSGDPTERAALEAMDEEPALSEGIERCRAVLRRESEVTAEVGRGVGPLAALALQLHYRDGYDWECVAIELRISIASLYRMRRTALEWVDSEGLVASCGQS